MLTKSDLSQIKKLFNNVATKEDVKKQVSPIKSDLGTIKEDLSQIRKDIKVIVTFFDHEYLDLRKRVEKIEEILKIQSSN